MAPPGAVTSRAVPTIPAAGPTTTPRRAPGRIPTTAATTQVLATPVLATPAGSTRQPTTSRHTPRAAGASRDRLPGRRMAGRRTSRRPLPPDSLLAARSPPVAALTRTRPGGTPGTPSLRQRPAALTPDTASGRPRAHRRPARCHQTFYLPVSKHHPTRPRQRCRRPGRRRPIKARPPGSGWIRDTPASRRPRATPRSDRRPTTTRGPRRRLASQPTPGTRPSRQIRGIRARRRPTTRGAAIPGAIRETTPGTRPRFRNTCPRPSRDLRPRPLPPPTRPRPLPPPTRPHSPHLPRRLLRPRRPHSPLLPQRPRCRVQSRLASRPRRTRHTRSRLRRAAQSTTRARKPTRCCRLTRGCWPTTRRQRHQMA